MMTVRHIPVFALAIFDVFAIMSVYGRLFYRKIKAIYLLPLAAVFTLLVFGSQLFVNGTVSIVLSVAFCFLMTLPFRAGWKQRVFYAVIIVALEVVAEIFAGILTSAATGHSLEGIAAQAETVGDAYIVGAVFAKLLFYLLARLMCRLHRMNDYNLPLCHWLLVMLVPLSSIIVQYGLALATTQYILTDYTAPFMILFGMLAINLLVFLVYDVLSDQNLHILEQERAGARITLELQHYEMLAAHGRRLAAQAHDIRSHLIALNGLIEQNRNAEAAKYIHAIVMPEFSGNATLVPAYPAVSALLSEQFAAAQKQGITVTHCITIPPELPLRELDLCVIFGNSLSNAIEACGRLTGNREKSISLEVRYAEHKLTVRLVNSSNAVEIEDGACKTSKADTLSHGYGLQNIRSVVEGLGGNMVIHCDEGMFVLSIILFV